MQYITTTIRRLVFPALMTVIVGGLWITAQQKAATDKWRLRADELACPPRLDDLAILPEVQIEIDHAVMVADEGNSGDLEGA